MAQVDLQAVTVLAGFYVGEQYHVPWAEVDVPQELQDRLFPFAKEALAQVKTSNPVNYGTVNFLELLQQLRPFFWQVSTCLIPFYHNSHVIMVQKRALLQFTVSFQSLLFSKGSRYSRLQKWWHSLPNGPLLAKSRMQAAEP